jgi:hypothetical protein
MTCLKGGLDRNGANGKSSIYYADHSNELMFHVVTMMPSVKNDEQQIDKKKFISNDSVHIVWR